jgi:uncharacterized membrane protein (Fun14 family)
MSETFLSTLASIGSGFFTGIMVGYFVKKIIKILVFVGGGLLGLLLYLQQQEIISVNIEKLESSSTFIVTNFASSFDSNIHINDTNFGIPLAGGISAGLAIGLMKG